MSNNAEPSQQYRTPYDDEISISELLMKLWARRGIIVALPLVLAGLTVVALLAGKSLGQSTISYFIQLNGIQLQEIRRENTILPDTFNANSNVDNNNNRMLTKKLGAYYPNGTVFSPQDLLNPSVLLRLSEETSVNPEDLAKAIKVDFGTPISNGLLNEYRAALSENSKASSQDLALINARYQSKLDAASKRGLKISVDLAALGIEESQGIQLADQLPELWSAVYTTLFNTTLNSNIARLPSTAMGDLTSTTGLQEADIQLNYVTRGAELLQEDGRLRALLNNRGAGPGDLLRSAENFRAIYFEPLYLEAFEGGSSLSRVYQQDLGLQINKVKAEIAELNARLTNIREFQNSGRSSNGQSGSGNQGSLDGSALTEVVGLAERAGLSNYLQATLDQRFELTRSLADLEAKLQRINQQPAASDKNITTEDFKGIAQQRYTQLLEDYSSLTAQAKVILESSAPRFYAPTTQPSIDGQLLERRDLLFIALALALGGMLAILAALLWPAKEN